LMTCDCLSFERREGTLGLLFLTPVRARDIVAAKALVHLLRALLLWLAVVPILSVPLLLGGLDWREVLLSCAFTLASIFLALSVGLIASALSRNFGRAAGLAVLLSGTSALGLVVITAWIVIALLFTNLPAPRGPLAFDWSEVCRVGIEVLLNTQNTWQDVFTRGTTPVAFKRAFIWLAGILCGLSALILVYVILHVAKRLQKTWQDKPKTARQIQVENFFVQPVFWREIFRRWTRRLLERNPIGWLELRSWTGRITALAWLAIMIAFASMAVSHSAFFGDGDPLLSRLGWVLIASMAFVAAGSFRRERETGALELILITPLREREIIFGRLRGLWLQFLPAFALWLAAELYIIFVCAEWGVWASAEQPFAEGLEAYLFRLAVVGPFLCLPAIGLYFSLRLRNVLLAWAATIGVWLAAHWFAEANWWFWSSSRFDLGVRWLETTVLLAFAAVLLWRMHVNLRRRTFVIR
jgi:ABC-type transport system involved in multi-copper enzyme maturation permease subunit